jgi:hypothetical protein
MTFELKIFGDATELPGILASLVGGKVAVTTEPAVAPESKKTKKAEKVETAVETTPEVVPPSANGQEISIEQVREAAQKKSAAGKRDEVKKLITDMGAAKVVDIPKEKFKEFMDKVNAL